MDRSLPSDLAADVQLAPNISAPSLARAALRAALGSSLPPDVTLDILIVTSELVTNSVQYAGLSPKDAVALRMSHLDRGRVEVEATEQVSKSCGRDQGTPGG